MYVRPQIILFGDSITQYSFGGTLVLSNATTTTRFGWGSLLSAAYARKADVYNNGFSGYNTRMALERELVPKLFGKSSSDPSSSLAFCTVFFGANDAALPPSPDAKNVTHTQHVPKDEYASNLRTIITSIRQETNPNFPIIVITPPPVNGEKWNASVGPYEHHHRTNEVSREYGLVATEVASEFGENCHVVDAWKVLKGDEGIDGYGKYMADGLHLTEDGNQALYDGIMELIQTKMKHLAPAADDADKDSECLRLQEPEWNELC